MDLNCPVEADLEGGSDAGNGVELEPEGEGDAPSGEGVTEGSFEDVIDDGEEEVGDTSAPADPQPEDTSASNDPESEGGDTSEPEDT